MCIYIYIVHKADRERGIRSWITGWMNGRMDASIYEYVDGYGVPIKSQL